MDIQELITFLENWAPKATQEIWDNSGLQIGDPVTDLTGVLLSLDVSMDVLQEAVDRGCNLIVSHHPFFFRDIKQITPSLPSYPLIAFALANRLCLYAMHTNLDNHSDGINRYLGRILHLTGMEVLRPSGSLKKLVTFCPSGYLEPVREALFGAGAGNIGQYDSCSYSVKGSGTFRASGQASPFVGEPGKLHTEEEYRLEVVYPSYLESQVLSALRSHHPYEEVAYDCYQLSNLNPLTGSGIIGMLPEAVGEQDFLAHVRDTFSLEHLRHTRYSGRMVSRVAICSGSGAFLIREALMRKADAFLTGDLKYHDFQETDRAILLTDIGHYESESPVKQMLVDRLKEKIPTFAVLISEHEVNPVCYYKQ